MGVPSSTDARLYYRSAYQRYEDAEVLLKAGRTTGAVYLAGYAIECILKSLVIMTATRRTRAGILKEFRGNKAHEYEWLRSLYLAKGGARFPREINQFFILVNDWSTELRYTPRQFRSPEAESFLTAAVAIIRWANERM
jgi:HEPN domain-containing protein